tara:strand:- start:214 stop:1446 length:1233 start_codon:yes stop_codon:yes gene_type:complete
MPLYKFEESDKFSNVLRTNPKTEFVVYDGQVFLNNRSEQSGSFYKWVPNVEPGNVSLYELNVDRLEEVLGTTIGVDEVENKGVIYPFVTKQGNITAFKTISTSQFNSDFSYGDVLSGSYPLSASIERHLFVEGASRPRIVALQNTLNFYKPLSSAYAYSSSVGAAHWNKATQPLNLISIPSIFYGSEIKKGSVKLQFYMSGTLIGELQDKGRNGELIQVSGNVESQTNGSGSVAGVVLYNEGFILLTGSWGMTSQDRDYLNAGGGNEVPGAWLYFGAGANDSIPTSLLPSSSFAMSFEGTQDISTLTMLAHAKKGQLNYSPNPTYIEWEQSASIATPFTGNYVFREKELRIKNMVSSSFAFPTASFQKETYITKVAIYDENRNMIGIANLATPVKKTEERDYTFKLKVDF